MKRTEFTGYSEISAQEMGAAMRFAVASVTENLKTFTDKFQKAYSENGFYQPIENNYWTTGFWTGEIWLAYEYACAHDMAQAADALRHAGTD